MNGVMIPGVSAGSNQVGASVTWMPQVSCPAGAAPNASLGAPAIKLAAVSARSSRRDTGARSLLEIRIPVSETEFAIACSFAAAFVGLVFTVEQPRAGCLLYLSVKARAAPARRRAAAGALALHSAWRRSAWSPRPG